VRKARNSRRLQAGARLVTALESLAAVTRSAALLLGLAPPRGALEDTVRRKYAHPAEVAAHRAEALAGPTPSQAAFLARWLAPRSVVLDVGCAAGRTALGAARRGHRVVGVDITAAMVREAVTLARELGLAARFCVMDARALAFPAGVFDAVLLLGSTLSYIPGRADRLRALGEAWRVLRPGGRVLVETQSREATPQYRLFFAAAARAHRLLTALGRRPAWEVGDRLGVRVSAARSGSAVYFHMYAPAELAHDLAEAGFLPVAVETSRYLMHYVGLKR